MPLRTGNTALPVGIGLDQAGVDRKTLAANKALGHAPLDNGLEQVAEDTALGEAAMPVIRKGRVVRRPAFETKAAEPAVAQVEVHLLAQPPL